tara:strand:+ start:365 stop:1390 length:1026 start_codon:yes stop_codon:yes gene_type:complete
MASPYELWFRHSTRLVVISILWGAAGLSAQEKGAPQAKPAEKTALPPPIFFLRDGSRITGVPGFDSLQIKTRYGVLKVPSSDLVRLRLTLRIEDDPDELIELEIQRLGGPEFEEREAAMDALRKFGSRALPYLEKLTRSDDEELRNRCSLLIGEIKSRAKESNKHGDEFPALVGGSDEIITKRFKIRGSIQDSSFKIKSRYGILDIKIADILGVDFRSTGNIQETVAISGKQVVPANWADTKLFVAPGTTLRIRASGNLLVKNYNLNSGPQGTTRYTGNTYKNFPMLSLVGKIGRKGTPFLIGANYKTITRAEGTLQLGVIPFRMNYTATGAYKVRVTTGE